MSQKTCKRWWVKFHAIHRQRRVSKNRITTMSCFISTQVVPLDSRKLPSSHILVTFTLLLQSIKSPISMTMMCSTVHFHFTTQLAAAWRSVKCFSSDQPLWFARSSLRLLSSVIVASTRPRYAAKVIMLLPLLHYLFTSRLHNTSGRCVAIVFQRQVNKPTLRTIFAWFSAMDCDLKSGRSSSNASTFRESVNSTAQRKAMRTSSMLTTSSVRLVLCRESFQRFIPSRSSKRIQTLVNQFEGPMDSARSASRTSPACLLVSESFCRTMEVTKEFVLLL